MRVILLGVVLLVVVLLGVILLGMTPLVALLALLVALGVRFPPLHTAVNHQTAVTEYNVVW